MVDRRKDFDWPILWLTLLTIIFLGVMVVWLATIFVPGKLLPWN
ncbi:MAG: hypothetical protein ACXWLO_05925 [Rhizomicrobium sp.]